MGEARRRGTFKERKVAAVKRDLEIVLKTKAEVANNPNRRLSSRASRLLASAVAMGYSIKTLDEGMPVEVISVGDGKLNWQTPHR